MHILTWNLRQNRAAPAWPQLQAVLGAELILLQETRKPDWPTALAWQKVPYHDRGSAALATQGRFQQISIADYEGWVVGGQLIDSNLTVNDKPLFVFSVHAPSPHPTQPRQHYVKEVMNILELISKHIPTKADLILGGDFNFCSLGQRHENERFQTTLLEHECLDLFTRLGLVNCWAASHPGRPLPQTLRWSSDKSPGKSTPYHCDGIFVPAAWQQKMFCEVLTSTCFEVSDHYPLVAWILSPLPTGERGRG